MFKIKMNEHPELLEWINKPEDLIQDKNIDHPEYIRY